MVTPGKAPSAPAGDSLDIVILGLSITSSWGNGHATTYRALVKGLVGRGHRVLFLERDVPWYAAARDMPAPPFCVTELYSGLDALEADYARAVADADVVIVGSYVPEGAAVGDWVLDTARGTTAFYDIDTPVTLGALETGGCEYLTPDLLTGYDLMLSFTGGPLLRRLELEFGARLARALYCCVDPELYYPEAARGGPSADLGYMGTYSPDRQPKLERLLLEPARRWAAGRFLVAGPLYPDALVWPPNVEHRLHVPPDAHRAFYGSARFTLNLTRDAMTQAGYAPSVRLFEAAACAVPILSDHWPGIEHFFTPGEEILIVESTEDVFEALQTSDDAERRHIGAAARRRVLAAHTADHRARELEQHLHDAAQRRPRRRRSR